MKVKVSEIRGRYSYEGKAYGPFQPSSEQPYTEVPEALANSLSLPRYTGKVKTNVESDVTPSVVQSEPPELQAQPVSTETPLPDDFPMHSALTGAGYKTLEAVKAATDEQLEAVDGIGAKTVERIREALK